MNNFHDSEVETIDLVNKMKEDKEKGDTEAVRKAIKEIIKRIKAARKTIKKPSTE